jgi:hypothetical protein
MFFPDGTILSRSSIFQVDDIIADNAELTTEKNIFSGNKKNF